MIGKIARRFNVEIKRIKPKPLPADFEDLHRKVVDRVQPFTMTSPERLFGLIEAIKYLHKNNISGDIVECGVWKGGSMMAVATVLKDLNDLDRNLFLYDTFEGMSAPTENDIAVTGEAAAAQLEKDHNKETNLVWAYSPLEEVKQNIESTNYPAQRIHYIKGKVEDTIPATMPGEIALLRLDTDWYESTKHEMIHLFPKLKKGGVLIIDDFGHWEGAKKAIVEYIEENKIQILLNRLDETGRIAIKQ
jgi:O-methyltransferase